MLYLTFTYAYPLPFLHRRIERFGWRRLSPLEKEALFTVMYHVGRCMKIEGVPDTLEKFDAWTEAFEQRRLVFAPQNHTVAVETVNLLLWAVPPWMRGPFFPVVGEYSPTSQGHLILVRRYVPLTQNGSLRPFPFLLTQPLSWTIGCARL